MNVPHFPHFHLITDPFFYAVAVPAVLLMGISKSGFGTGFGSLAVPLIALAVTMTEKSGLIVKAWCQFRRKADQP